MDSPDKPMPLSPSKLQNAPSGGFPRSTSGKRGLVKIGSSESLTARYAAASRAIYMPSSVPQLVRVRCLARGMHLQPAGPRVKDRVLRKSLTDDLSAESAWPPKDRRTNNRQPHRPVLMTPQVLMRLSWRQTLESTRPRLLSHLLATDILPTAILSARGLPRAPRRAAA